MEISYFLIEAKKILQKQKEALVKWINTAGWKRQNAPFIYSSELLLKRVLRVSLEGYITLFFFFVKNEFEENAF